MISKRTIFIIVSVIVAFIATIFSIVLDFKPLNKKDESGPEQPAGDPDPDQVDTDPPAEKDTDPDEEDPLQEDPDEKDPVEKDPQDLSAEEMAKFEAEAAADKVDVDGKVIDLNKKVTKPPGQTTKPPKK